MFIEELKSVLNERKKLTENGAIGYETSGKALVDLNFATSSLRDADDNSILSMFIKAFAEDKDLAIKWLFFARDIRGGMGERRIFRIITRQLAENYPVEFGSLLKYIPEFGRWDDLVYLLEGCLRYDIEEEIFQIIIKQLNDDMKNAMNGKPISLLAKWLPSENASSRKARRLAKKVISGLEIDPRDYRRMLSKLRKHLNIVEANMCSNNWDDIDFSAVPSNANLKYRNAFFRHLPEKYSKFIQSVSDGNESMHVGNLYPHEIVREYKRNGYYGELLETEEPDLEAMWSSLPRELITKKTIVVSDGSGSMYSNCGKVAPIDVAQSLAIYFSESCVGEFKDRYITFSARPQLIDFSSANSLHEKLEIIEAHDEISSTNIEAVFDLILQTAMRGNMNQEDIPEVVLIISDMEFDSATGGVFGCSFDDCPTVDKALFDNISDKYKNQGYKLPKLVFWNVGSRTNVVPIRENDLGVALLSGYSPNIVDMVMSGNLDPYEVLLERLMSDRYKDIKFKVK